MPRCSGSADSTAEMLSKLPRKVGQPGLPPKRKNKRAGRDRREFPEDVLRAPRKVKGVMTARAGSAYVYASTGLPVLPSQISEDDIEDVLIKIERNRKGEKIVVNDEQIIMQDTYNRRQKREKLVDAITGETTKLRGEALDEAVKSGSVIAKGTFDERKRSTQDLGREFRVRRPRQPSKPQVLAAQMHQLHSREDEVCQALVMLEGSVERRAPLSPKKQAKVSETHSVVQSSLARNLFGGKENGSFTPVTATNPSILSTQTFGLPVPVPVMGMRFFQVPTVNGWYAGETTGHSFQSVAMPGAM